MKRLAQTRPPETLARALTRIAALEAEVKELTARRTEDRADIKLLLQMDPKLEARIQDLEAQVRVLTRPDAHEV
jgi:hypothetical protein